MASHGRFEDEQYKNWLKTTMSLQLLRTSLGDFLENETETFHNSLKNKLNEATCKNNCTVKASGRNKVPEVCPVCKPWGEEIFKNHNNKRGDIYWNNSKPCLWSSRKWEVAKVYMPRGNKDHHAVDQFDISAVLNLMHFCSHFKNFVKERMIKEVTHVRNQMMHSADMKVAKEDMQKHLSKILDFVKHLQDRVPHLNKLKDKISQLEEAELNIMVERQARDTSQKDAAMNLMNKQKILDLEQQVLKEKIESLASRLEEDKDLNNEELQRMKEFLDQNKDLLEQLGPHMEKLNAIQVKVEQHDQQLTDLTETVDQLVKKTEEPAFSADTVKYKNHLFEEAKKNKWPDPMFDELRKSQGYIGQVVVNGRTFTGCLVHPNKTAAHQEVSKIALEQLHLQSKEEGSLSEDDQSASTSAANSLFFAEVKVPVKTEFKGPEAGSSEAAVLEAYKSLVQALNLGDAGAGSPFDDARERVCVFFSRAHCDPPKECVSTTDGKFMCTLCIDGNMTFQNPEGMFKKRQAENAAAKEALLRLARVLDWDLAGVKENYKGRLQEMLVKQGQELPSYQPVFEPVHTEPSHRGAESEKSLASVPIPQAAVSVSNMESQARASVDSSQFPLQVQMPKTEAPAPVMPTVQPSESNFTQRSDSDVPVVHHNTAVGQAIIPAMPIHTNESSVPSANSLVFVGVTVPVKTEFKGPEAGSSEAAVLEAYKSVALALNLGDAGAGSPSDDARQRVCVFFSRARCDPPKEYVSTTDGKFMCTLCIDGNMTFQNPEGTSKKRQAENAAAKEALHRLARVLDWDLAGVNENYKGRLQEILVKQGQKPPSYQPGFEPVHTEPSHRGAESEKRKSPDNHTQLLPDVKKPKRESPDFGRVLRMFGLQPTSVSCENFNVKEWFKLTAEINLVNFTYTNQQGCNNKKEAIRKAYLIFGQATGICQPCTEEIQASMAVKQYFSQNSFSLPTEEVVEKEKKKFYCSLKVASCRLSFEGQGESEEAARLEACKQALSQLGQLFDYKSPSSSERASEERLTFLLEDAGQGPPVLRKADVLYTADAQLNLNDFTLECKGQSSKKLAQSRLCAQILILLGQKETETCSERNQVDDWFKQKGLPQPVFADTEESGPDKKAVFGMKATFSALITFTHPDWQASEEEAVTELLGELKRRLKAC